MSDQQKPSSAQVQWLTIGGDYQGQRLDNFLLAMLKGVPKTRIYSMMRKGEIRINRKRVKPDYRIVGGEELRLPPVRLPERDAPPLVSAGLSKKIEDAILYEDDALMVINKPSGLAVHGGSGISLGLIESLRQLRPQLKMLELVHRLDRDTSGCILVAKKRSALRVLHEALRDGGVDKVYHALVQGRWSSRHQHVNAPLKKNELRSGERVVRVEADGKPSLTEFKVLRRFASYTLIEAKPITGRTHQIRVHTQFAGHPIIGDDKYGVDEVNKVAKQYGLNRLFLHAAKLTFRHPVSGEVVSIKADYDVELHAVIDRLAAEIISTE
ncbi:23S rRNA pseudouridylate synthase [Pokkaliibacter plantistimulans]|uniref:Pseudouridine synthase n=1 Tax=Pokkaliibacter plantistimulans TaxID=1635171 RepID=A0ABX5LQI3_9GAMM|nr:23S rRNA pseudouridine(955/2504/2580) synthase RluC [Pokkaliibacter plantistimulans]PXF28651.1 23S rRNA pseudouridylate synthase [Pokkaliibacter plantistimulans]